MRERRTLSLWSECTCYLFNRGGSQHIPPQYRFLEGGLLLRHGGTCTTNAETKKAANYCSLKRYYFNTTSAYQLHSVFVAQYRFTISQWFPLVAVYTDWCGQIYNRLSGLKAPYTPDTWLGEFSCWMWWGYGYSPDTQPFSSTPKMKTSRKIKMATCTPKLSPRGSDFSKWLPRCHQCTGRLH